MAPRLTLDDRLIVAPDVVSRDLEGETVILNLDTGLYFGLDAVGTTIWNRIRERSSLRDVLEQRTGRISTSPLMWRLRTSCASPANSSPKVWCRSPPHRESGRTDVSTIAGILHLDGRPVSRDDLSRLSRHLSHRIGDAEGTWIDGPIGVFVRVLHTTEETAGEQQPWHDSRLTVTFDGRLDNRGELMRALDLPVDQEAITGDAAIVAGTYQKWGDECASHLLGDFAFIVWDRLEQRLFGARDVIGIRPFYYRLEPSRLLWAPEPHALLRYDGTAPAPNEGVVGEFLANAVTDKCETLLAGITRLPPAHTLVIDRGGAHIRRYWDIDPSRELKYRHEREYVEHLDMLLREAVAARLRASGPVGVLLSSGLDSSTVLGVARTFSGDARRLRAYTLAAAGAADESPGARLTADHWGVPHYSHAADLSRPLPLVADVQRYFDLPDYPSATVAAPLRASARADGARVLLTGMASDDWFGGSLFRYADYLRRGALAPLGA